MTTTEQLLEGIANELVRMNGTLEHLLGEVRDLRMALGNTSRSSVELSQNAKGAVQIAVKSYADSPVEEAGNNAVAEFGRLYRLAEENMLNGWRDSLEALSASRGNGA